MFWLVFGIILFAALLGFQKLAALVLTHTRYLYWHIDIHTHTHTQSVLCCWFDLLLGLYYFCSRSQLQSIFKELTQYRMHLIVVTCTKSYAKVPACCCTIAIEYTIEVFLLRFYAKKYIFDLAMTVGMSDILYLAIKSLLFNRLH